MRSTVEILCAVKDCEPVTEEELRLALVSMSSIEHFIRHDLRDLIEAVEGSKTSAKHRATFAKDTIERMHKAMKMPVDQWLGPADRPGTPENKARMATCRKIFKAATGQDL